MSTWMQDIQRTNPKLASAYAITGNQSRDSLRNMVRALTVLPALNTADDEKRLEAAKYILKQKGR